MHGLPDLPNYEAFQAWRADSSPAMAAALDIARHHGLRPANPQIFSTGTNLVVGLDDRLILKLFPPFLRGQFESERISLAQLRRAARHSYSGHHPRRRTRRMAVSGHHAPVRRAGQRGVARSAGGSEGARAD